MKKRIISLVLLGISVLTVTACAALQAQSQCMAEKIIRLHVVANSDSDVDQAVKLRVRDAVLREAQNVLSDASDAKQAIAAQLPALEAAANAEEMEEKEWEAPAGGGAVTVKISGKKEVLSVKLDPEVVDPDDIEMIEDLIVAATNEALRKVEEESAEMMSALTGGLGGGLGGLF